MKIKNRTFAIDAAPAAMPKKPKAPAIIAMIRKMTVQRNITHNLVNNVMLCRTCSTGSFLKENPQILIFK